MKKFNFILKIFVAFIMVLSSCSQEAAQKWQGKPHAVGKMNQIIVVADKTMWEGAVGDTFDMYFASPYLVLPQPEPIYDLRYFAPEKIINYPENKEFRTFIFLSNLKDTDSPTTQIVRKDIGNEKIRAMEEEKGFANSVGKDKWAQNQLVVYMMGISEDKIIENIKKSFPSIIKRIEEQQKVRIEATVYHGGENAKLKQEIQNNFGIQIAIPHDYIQATYDDENHTMWLRKDTKEANSNILLHKLSYKDQSQLTKAGIKAIRDDLGRRYVSTNSDGSYMRTNDVDLPMFTFPKNINNYYALEARGIWDIVNDYMGGPFISYLIHNPNSNELLYVDGFIHAPGEEKRDHMQELEHILSSVKF